MRPDWVKRRMWMRRMITMMIDNEEDNDKPVILIKHSIEYTKLSTPRGKKEHTNEQSN